MLVSLIFAPVNKVNHMTGAASKKLYTHKINATVSNFPLTKFFKFEATNY